MLAGSWWLVWYSPFELQVIYFPAFLIATSLSVTKEIGSLCNAYSSSFTPIKSETTVVYLALATSSCALAATLDSYVALLILYVIILVN